MEENLEESGEGEDGGEVESEQIVCISPATSTCRGGLVNRRGVLTDDSAERQAHRDARGRQPRDMAKATATK